jgi:formiminotetrahydrofolate cyclodeaminase
MPKATDEEKAARSAAIQAGLEGCTATPFEMMELAAQTIELTESLLGRFNTASASDLGVGALSLRTAVQGAWLNVLINIGSLKNKELAEDYRAKGTALVERVVAAADRVYAEVLTLV